MEKEIEDPLILKDHIKRLNTPINKFFNLSLSLGSLAFLFTGTQSYFNNSEILKTTYIVFYPQGLTMCFYGILGLLISLNQTINQYYKVGEGYNEFNKKNGEIKIYRRLGKEEKIYIKYKIKDIVGI